MYLQDEVDPTDEPNGENDDETVNVIEDDDDDEFEDDTVELEDDEDDDDNEDKVEPVE